LSSGLRAATRSQSPLLFYTSYSAIAVKRDDTVATAEQAREAIEKSPLPSSAKLLLLGLHKGAHGFEASDDVINAIVDDLFAAARAGQSLKDPVGMLLQIANGYETAHASPRVTANVATVIDRLGARLSASDASKANARSAAVTFLGGNTRPRLATTKNDAPAFKPWALQANR
jgi:hypothetical protein